MTYREIEFFTELFYKTRNFSLLADMIYDFKLTNSENDSLFVYEEFEIVVSNYLVKMDENVRFLIKIIRGKLMKFFIL